MTTRPRTHHTTEFELLDALREPGCALCRLGLRAEGHPNAPSRRVGDPAVRRFLDALAYEGVNDPENRARLRAAQGFCNRHAWQWLREARSVLGTALIYQDVLQTVVADLEQAAAAGAAPGGLLGTFGIGTGRGPPAPAPCSRRRSSATSGRCSTGSTSPRSRRRCARPRASA